ncbi:MAG: DUF4331 family protein [Bdellovibrionales bacterium]|nr:DUF4331 family protein [Bdellovibrionales bacterium]
MNRISTLASVFALGVTLAACSGDSDGKDYVQRDRMGVSAVATGLIAVERRDDFNAGDPTLDRSEFFDEMVARVEALRAAVAAVPGFPPEDSPGVPAETVVGLVNPDVMTIDLSAPTVFPNGRGLTDDTIDPILGLVLNRGNVLGGGPGISDGVSNDSPTIGQFPYAAPPQAQ